MTTFAPPDEAARARVVSDLGTTFLVEAGAGTGKTNVLLQRFLALLRTGRGRMDRIAAITFSEKAAAELRIRLRAEIEMALMGALTDAERSNLRSARAHLDRAQISTVHAFCAALLRERPVEAHIDPAFTVIDQFDAGLLQAETWNAWLADEMDRGPDVLKHAVRAGVTLSHLETLRDFAVEHRDCLSLLPALVDSPLPEFQTSLAHSITQLSRLKKSCVHQADRALTQIKALEALIPVSADDTLWERVFLRDLPVNTKVGTKANWQPTTVLDEVRTLFSQIATAYTQSRAAWSHNLTVALVHWLKGYLLAYEAKKREQSSLDFADLLLCTRDLLTSNLEVRRYFQNRFDFLLVDEFQDTDPLQIEVVFLLAEREPRARDWTQAELAPGKLFLVGDPQQSIYRFRRADLEVYTQARVAIERQGEILSLSTNFRTRAPILTWLNETFAQAFAAAGEDQPPYRPLTAARSEDTGREVVFLPVPRELLSERPTREDSRQAEARTVAAFLKQAVEHTDFAVWGGRSFRYRDIAVLFRTHQAMDAYEEACKNAGVPYRVLGGRRYASRQEIEELRTLLRTIDSPSDTTALVATLRSSLFGFSDEELAQFVCEGGKLDYLLSVPNSLPAADRFTAAFTLLSDLHVRSPSLSPAALLCELYARTHLVPLFALRPQGTQRVANLLKLIDLARALSTRGLSTLPAFNRFLAQQHEAAEEGESFITEEHDDALRFLTIHKAKGLEFPVVVLADAMANHGGRSHRTGIIERSSGCLELQVGPRSLTLTTQEWQKAEAREQVRDEAEERRLWYVAAARVRDHLIVPISPRPEKGATRGQWTVTDNTELPETDSLAFTSVPNWRGYIYRSAASIIEQIAPTAPLVSLFTEIQPEQTAMQAYQHWEVERQAVLAKGKQLSVQPLVTARPTLSSFSSLKGIEPEEAERQLAGLLSLPLLVRARSAVKCLAAVPFTLHHKNCLLDGVIDLAFVEDDAWVVTAFHTDAGAEGASGESIPAFQFHLALQALALGQLTGLPVKELVLLFVQSRQERHFPWNEQERATIEILLDKVVSQPGHPLIPSVPFDKRG